MPVLAIDLGGTKLAVAVFSNEGDLLAEEKVPLAKREGSAVGALIAAQVKNYLSAFQVKGEPIHSIGVSVPGIFYPDKGTVWAPNISGWDAYPLLEEISRIAGNIPVNIDSDRACYILGEWWQGAAKYCTDAIYLAVGTGIGAGILIEGKVFRGAHNTAGAIGWIGLQRPFSKNFQQCGCLESMASGEGIVRQVKTALAERSDYKGPLKHKPAEELTAADVFAAYEQQDPIASEVFDCCIELWGMATANLVSLFDPQKIILGGGVFGPGITFLPAIRNEATKWAQPLSMQQVSIEVSALGNRAGLYGAGYLALQHDKTSKAIP